MFDGIGTAYVMCNVCIAFLQFCFCSLFHVHIRTVIWWVSVFCVCKKRKYSITTTTSTTSRFGFKKYQWTVNKSINRLGFDSGQFSNGQIETIEQGCREDIGIMNVFFYFKDEFEQKHKANTNQTRILLFLLEFHLFEANNEIRIYSFYYLLKNR